MSTKPCSNAFIRILRVVSVALFAVLLTIPATGDAKLRVAATVGDLGAMAREIVGDQGEVDLLVRPTEDPHFVDPRPSHVRRLARADLLILVGVDLEVGWLPTLITGSRNNKLQPGQPGHFDASQYVVLQGVPAGTVDRSMGDVHPGGNPHFSTDPRQMARVAVALGSRLGKLDPKNADAYQERARNFARECIRAAQLWEAKFAALPKDRRKIVTYHKAWSYVTTWLDIEDVIQIEPKPGVAPNPRHVAQVVEAIRSQEIPVILQSEFYPSSTANILSEQTGATLVVVPAQSRENETYVEHINKLVDLLYRGMHED